MVKLYLTEISALADPLDKPELLEQVTEVRKQRILGMKNEKNRRQCFAAGLLLEKVLKEYGQDPKNIVIGKHGKPELEGIYFNLSHSDDMVICAVSDKPVGCDVERLRQAPKGIATRYFSEKEQVYLEQFGGEDYDKEFFRLWTVKESYVKMTGEGMGLYRGGEEEKFCVSEMQIDGYLITVCAEDETPVEVIEERG